MQQFTTPAQVFQTTLLGRVLLLERVLRGEELTTVSTLRSEQLVHARGHGGQFVDPFFNPRGSIFQPPGVDFSTPPIPAKT